MPKGMLKHLVNESKFADLIGHLATAGVLTPAVIEQLAKDMDAPVEDVMGVISDAVAIQMEIELNRKN
jgi:Flp pilus assembly protein TadB